MRLRRLACVLAASVLLCGCSVASGQKLTGKAGGSGISCIPNQAGVAGGCGDKEACCPTTSTCVKASSCAEFAGICPPPACGKNTDFFDSECPAEVSKMFKSPKGLKCQSSSDAMCYTNGTAMVLSCTNAAGAAAIKMVVMAVALGFALMVVS